jgi:hypothetical protein
VAGRPRKSEKEKLVSVGLSISPEQEIELKKIAKEEDRDMGYIKRAFYQRGLLAYKLDGQLKDVSSLSNEKEMREAFYRLIGHTEELERRFHELTGQSLIDELGRQKEESRRVREAFKTLKFPIASAKLEEKKPDKKRGAK